jgi:hypothetical protein
MRNIRKAVRLLALFCIWNILRLWYGFLLEVTPLYNPHIFNIASPTIFFLNSSSKIQGHLIIMMLKSILYFPEIGSWWQGNMLHSCNNGSSVISVLLLVFQFCMPVPDRSPVQRLIYLYCLIQFVQHCRQSFLMRFGKTNKRLHNLLNMQLCCHLNWRVSVGFVISRSPVCLKEIGRMCCHSQESLLHQPNVHILFIT